jgi:hypothetical protein
MKDSLILQDKNYISARRVHELFGYTSDYVGQLCRAGKLDAKMIGRAWFVTMKSVIDYQAHLDEIAKTKVKDRKKTAKKLYRRSLGEAELSKEISSLSESREVEENVKEEVKSIESVIQASEAPIIEKEFAPINSHIDIPFIPVVNTTYIEEIEEEVLPITPEVREEESIVTPIHISVEESEEIPVYVEEVPVSIPSPYISKKAFAKISIASGIFVCALVLVLSTGVFSNKALVGSASVSDGFGSRIVAFITNLFHKDRVIVQSEPNATEAVVKKDIPFNGMAVVPATDSDVQNEIIKQKIRESFSDDVMVRPDQDGSSGVITPVFRKTNGDDFLYVLVPVNQ